MGRDHHLWPAERHAPHRQWWHGRTRTTASNQWLGPADDLSVTRSDGEYATGLRKQIPVFSEYTYEIDYRSIDDQFRLYLHDMDWGQSVIFNLGPVPDDLEPHRR